MCAVETLIAKSKRTPSSTSAELPQIPEPYALLGLIYLDDGKLPNALTFYKLACTRDPRNLQYHQQAARISRELGDHTSRLEILRVLARLQPTDLNVAMEKASCLMELERPRQVGTQLLLCRSTSASLKKLMPAGKNVFCIATGCV